MQVAFILGVLIALLALVFWLTVTSKKEGQVNERERAQRQALEDAEAANRIARDVHRRRAADRLREEFPRE